MELDEDVLTDCIEQGRPKPDRVGTVQSEASLAVLDAILENLAIAKKEICRCVGHRPFLVFVDVGREAPWPFLPSRGNSESRMAVEEAYYRRWCREPVFERKNTEITPASIGFG